MAAHRMMMMRGKRMDDGGDHSRGLELYSLGMRAKRAEARKKGLSFC